MRRFRFRQPADQRCERPVRPEPEMARHRHDARRRDVTVLDCGGGWKRDWCQVQAGNVKGFVAAGVLGTQGNNVEVAPVTTNNDVAIYKGPGVNYKILGSIPENTTVNIGACVYGWGETTWCKVNYGGKNGYALQSELQRQNSLFPM